MMWIYINDSGAGNEKIFLDELVDLYIMMILQYNMMIISFKHDDYFI